MAEEIHGIKEEPLENGDTTIEFKIIEDSKAFFDETESKVDNKSTEDGFDYQTFGDFCEPKVEQYEESTMVGDPLTLTYQPFICDFSLLFISTSEDGKLNNLQELTELGQNFLICCLHLLLEPESKEKTTLETTIFETFKWIKENGKLQIGRAQLSKIINSWVASSTKSCQSDINWTENEWENTKSYESETKLIKNDLKNTAQSKVLKKNQRKCKKIHKNPLPKNKDKIAELKSLLKNQCGNHSIKSMAESLEINLNTVRAWIHRDKIVFQKHDGPCHFCDIRIQNMHEGEVLKKSQRKKHKIHKNPPPKNKDKNAELKSLLKNQCGIHSNISMADDLEINVNTVRGWIHRDKIAFQKHDGPCHFCDIRIQNMNDGETLDTKQKRGNVPNNNYQREINLDMVKKQCGKHTMEEMATTLKISRGTIMKWKKKYKITWYSSETVDCIFCKNPTIKKSNKREIFEIGLDMLKKQCGDHSREEMAKVLKVNPGLLWLWEKKYKITYSRETGDCSFCVMRTIIRGE